MMKILFVCMGNICRSPSAEGFFAKAVKRSSFRNSISIDSAGTHGYHVGHAPDSRAIETASGLNVDIASLRARKVSEEDFYAFDLVIAMDRSNFEDLKRIQPTDSTADLKLMMDYHPDQQSEDVPDPYYGGMQGFTYMCELLETATASLLTDVEKRLA